MFQPIYTREVGRVAKKSKLTVQELDAVQVVHRETKTIGDKVAHKFVKTLRSVASIR